MPLTEPWSKKHKRVTRAGAGGLRHNLSNSYAQPLTHAELVQHTLARGDHADMRSLLHAISMARRTLRVIRGNLLWAAGYNLVAVPLAMAGLVTPWVAAVGMSASSLLVVGNAMRLLRHEAPATPAPAPGLPCASSNVVTGHRPARDAARAMVSFH